MDPRSFDLISFAYGVAVLFTLWELVRNRRALFDAQFTGADFALAGRIGFLLLTPLGVLGHELGHYATAAALGGRGITLDFHVYWGYVTAHDITDPSAWFLVALAGPAVSVVLGFAALVAARRIRQPAPAAILQVFGSTSLLLILVAYPLISFLTGSGDYLDIYSTRTPLLSAVTLACHGALLVAMVALRRRRVRRSRRPGPPPAYRKADA